MQTFTVFAFDWIAVVWHGESTFQVWALDPARPDLAFSREVDAFEAHPPPTSYEEARDRVEQWAKDHGIV